MNFITLIALPIYLLFLACRCQEHWFEEWRVDQCSQGTPNCLCQLWPVLRQQPQGQVIQYSYFLILAGLNFFVTSFTLGLENTLLSGLRQCRPCELFIKLTILSLIITIPDEIGQDKLSLQLDVSSWAFLNSYVSPGTIKVPWGNERVALNW